MIFLNIRFTLLFALTIIGTASSTACLENEFSCNKDHNCIPIAKQCDGVRDCNDSSDEINCSAQKCQENQFRCLDNQCIELSSICNGLNDCSDGLDELHCSISSPANCPENKFRCDDNQCVSVSKKCDGHNDCLDGSDEENCVIGN